MGCVPRSQESLRRRSSRFSDEVNGQRPFTRTESTRDASKIPEFEGEKPKTQVNSALRAKNIMVVAINTHPGMAAPINLNAGMLPPFSIRRNQTSTNVAITFLALSTIGLIIGILVLLASEGIVNITAFKIGMTGGTAITAIAGAIWLPTVLKCFQILNSHRSIKRKLEEWCAEAPLETNRVRASNNILNAVHSNNPLLNFSNLQLTSLPDIFDQLPKCDTIYAPDNQLSRLPPSLARSQVRYLYIERNQFRFLPAWINDMQLEALCVSNNRDIALPLTLPITLRQLHFSNNNFDTFPIQICTLINLSYLDFSNNRIRELPDWIGNLSNLERIIGSHNQMQSLPDSLGQLRHLINIDVSHNLIESIPITMCTLQVLQSFNISDNHLTAIPIPLVALNMCEINVERNRLMPEAITLFEIAIANQRVRTGMCFVRLRASVYAPPIDPFQNPFDEVQGLDIQPLERYGSRLIRGHVDALIRSARRSREDVLYWEELAAQTEGREAREASFFEPITEDPSAEALRLFLREIPLMQDYICLATRDQLIVRLMHILTGATTNPLFREKFFNLLQEASGTCGDRVATLFVRIEGYCHVYCADHPLSLTELRDMIMGMRRIELVTHYAQQLAERLGAGDQMEIILFCLLRLKKRLDLPTSIQDMLHELMAQGVTESDLNEIATEVIRETNHIYHQLIQSEIWRERILADNQEELQAKKDSIISDLEELEKKNEAGKIESEAYVTAMNCLKEQAYITEMDRLQKQFNQLEADFIGLKTRESLYNRELLGLIAGMKRVELVTHYAKILAKRLGRIKNQTQFIQFCLHELRQQLDLPPTQERLSERRPYAVNSTHLQEIARTVEDQMRHTVLTDSEFWQERIVRDGHVKR